MVGCFRPHVSGEFIDYDHFERMCKFIAQHKETQFYCYTEAEEYVDKAEDKGIIPDKEDKRQGFLRFFTYVARSIASRLYLYLCCQYLPPAGTGR